MIGDLVELHAIWEADRPKEREYAEEMERHVRLHHERVYGSLDGYTPSREFPCPGALRRVAVNATHEELECDRCGYTTTQRRTLVAADRSTPF